MVKEITTEQLQKLMRTKTDMNIISNDPFILTQARISQVPNIYSFRKFIGNGHDPSMKESLLVLIQRKKSKKMDPHIYNTLLAKGYKHIVEYKGSLKLRKSLPEPAA